MRRLVRDMADSDLIRLDDTTVAVAGGALCKAIMAARPLHDFERIVFKPVANVPVSNAIFAAVMKALVQDVRRVAVASPQTSDMLAGVWPKAGYDYLRERLYSSDPAVLRLLSHPLVNRSRGLKATFETLSLRHLEKSRLPREASALALLIEALQGEDRVVAVALYRRAAESLCITVAGLATSALWLGATADGGAPLRMAITETLRLLPPAWLYHREASEAFAALDARIRATDSLLIVPFVAQRNPAVWRMPDRFDPSRWEGVGNPEANDHYFPFGHGTDRCWAREVVLMLTEYTLREIGRKRLRVDPERDTVTMPMKTLLTISRMELVAR